MKFLEYEPKSFSHELFIYDILIIALLFFLKRELIYLNYNILKNIFIKNICGDWGLGIGDWGLGQIPNPQSPIPNPQSPIPIKIFLTKLLKYFIF